MHLFLMEEHMFPGHSLQEVNFSTKNRHNSNHQLTFIPDFCHYHINFMVLLMPTVNYIDHSRHLLGSITTCLCIRVEDDTVLHVQLMESYKRLCFSIHDSDIKHLQGSRTKRLESWCEHISDQLIQKEDKMPHQNNATKHEVLISKGQVIRESYTLIIKGYSSIQPKS